MLKIIENVNIPTAIGGIVGCVHMANSRYEVYMTEYIDGQHEVEVATAYDNSELLDILVRNGLDDIVLLLPDGTELDTADVAQTVGAYMSASPELRLKLTVAFDTVRAVKAAVNDWERTMSLLNGDVVMQKVPA